MNRHSDARNWKHGLADTKTYKIWQGMKGRCQNRRDAGYENYGGRGISVCERWLDFAKFYEDMGECPPGMSIERKDNDGNYEPGNCKWATRLEQNNNSRNCHFIEFRGERHTVTGWSKRLGMNLRALRARLSHGWTEEDALTIPTGEDHGMLARSLHSKNMTIVLSGKEMTFAEASRICGINRTTIRYRIASGWTAEDAVSVPVSHANRSLGSR